MKKRTKVLSGSLFISLASATVAGTVVEALELSTSSQQERGNHWKGIYMMQGVGDDGQEKEDIPVNSWEGVKADAEEGRFSDDKSGVVNGLQIIRGDQVFHL